MKKIYQRPQTDSYVIESEQLLDILSVGKSNSDTKATNSNSTQFSRESGGWDDDY